MRHKSNKRSVIILLVTIALLIVSMLVYSFITSFFLKNECSICGKETKESVKYCADCSEKYKCENCDSINRNNDEGFCEECKKELPVCSYCSDTILKGMICQACFDKEFTSETPICKFCENEVHKADEVFKITSSNEVYCIKCDTGNYCQSCGDVLDRNDDDLICFVCSEIYCSECREVLTPEENVSLYETVGLCADCDTGNYCRSCSRVISADDDDNVCFTCADFYCHTCKEVISESEISYQLADKTDKKYYCRQCDTGKYCNSCKAPIGQDEIYCNDCYTS